MKIKLYVVMHKVVDIEKYKLSKMYTPLLVGSFNKEEKNILRDDQGENISNKNANYCELTGLYWMWKNADDDILGLCHYRRFLSKSSISKNPKKFINEKDIEKDFEEGYNLIMPCMTYHNNRIKDINVEAPTNADLAILREVINDLYPEYISDFDLFYQESLTYLCNVMITKKEILDKYCKWLFEILFETEKRMNPDDYLKDSFRKRMFGFLSERLLYVWILHNKDMLKIKEYPLINVEQSDLERIKYQLAMFKNWIYYKLRFKQKK